MALTVLRGQVTSVDSATDAGTLSNNANINEDATGKSYNVLTGQAKSVATNTDAGTLSNNANVKVN